MSNLTIELEVNDDELAEMCELLFRNGYDCVLVRKNNHNGYGGETLADYFITAYTGETE